MITPPQMYPVSLLIAQRLKVNKIFQNECLTKHTKLLQYTGKARYELATIAILWESV